MIAWIKKFGPYIAALYAVIAIPYVLITTPSLSQSRSRLGVMEGDLREMFKNGGRIINRREVDKYGVASLSVEVVGELLSDEDLVRLGWTSIGLSGGGYCKDGIFLSVRISPQIFLGQKVLDLDFRYTSQTIATCYGHRSATHKESGNSRSGSN
ncbi:hypothetical protein ACQVBX_13490 [Dyella sp. KULCS107]|uniref:hypothetical protein n=1 Tax=Dyella sp. KULCS107 TaxID=3422216 RepID=UPI003D6E7336